MSSPKRAENLIIDLIQRLYGMYRNEKQQKEELQGKLAEATEMLKTLTENAGEALERIKTAEKYYEKGEKTLEMSQKNVAIAFDLYTKMDELNKIIDEKIEKESQRHG